MPVAPCSDREQDQDLNTVLQQLIAQAQTQTGLDRRRTLNQLIKTIQTSGELGHPQIGLWPPGQYEDFYQEALQKTLLYIATHLDLYRPTHPVMAWVNQILNSRFIDVLRSQKRHITVMSLDDLTQPLPAAAAPESDADQLKQHLETTPIYAQTHIQCRPDASFRAICIMRINGMPFIEIATELSLNKSTVYQFFTRNWTKFLPKIRQFFLGE